MIREDFVRWRAKLMQPIGAKELLVVAFALFIGWTAAKWGAFNAEAPVSNKSLGIYELVEKVRADLERVQREMNEGNRAALFDLQDMEMEIHFVVRGDAGAKIEVVGTGGEFNVGSEKVQKLKLRWAATPEKKRTAEQGKITLSPTHTLVPNQTAPSR